MSWIIEEVVNRSKRVDQLVRLKVTGTPLELADRLQIPISALYKLINTMKEVFGVPIYYCKKRKSYVYEDEGRLEIGFKRDEK